MYRVMSDCFLENEFGSDDNEIHHIRKKNQYKPSEGKECNRADNLQLLLMSALYDCDINVGKPVMYTTTITENVEDIEAEAYVLDVEKILKQNLEECE